MKHILFLTIFAIVLTACDIPATAINTSIPSTETITLSPVPSQTPTFIPTPTETPDPSMPLDATGKDIVTGLYIKTAEDGKTMLYWEPMQYGTDAEKGVKGHWFETRMTNGQEIFLYNVKLAGLDGKLADTIPFSQYMIQNHKQLLVNYVLRHPDQMKDFGPGTPLEYASLTMQLQYYLLEAIFDKNHKDLTDAGYADYYKTLNTTASIPAGKDRWILSKGYREYVVDYNMAARDKSFQKTDNYYWKIKVIDGCLTAFIATSELNKLSDRDMRIMAFAPMWEVILHRGYAGQKIKSFWGGPGVVDAALGSQKGGSQNVTYPNVATQPTTNFLEIDYTK